VKSELTADKIFFSVYAALRTHKLLQELGEQRQQFRAQTEILEPRNLS
jgi:pyrroline-5-carboxylate reductase